MLGLAINCKQPLGSSCWPSSRPDTIDGLGLREQSARLGLVLAGLAIGVAVYKGYDLYKFPPGTVEGHAELLKTYAPNWPGHPLAALLALGFSLGTGVFFYFPPSRSPSMASGPGLATRGGSALPSWRRPPSSSCSSPR